jgi:hypothetical protein
MCLELEAIVFRMLSVSDKMLKEFYVSWTGIVTISREYV